MGAAAGKSPHSASIALVLPARNEEEFIVELLDSVFDQSIDPHDLQVILVDGLSNDRTVERAIATARAAGWRVSDGVVAKQSKTLTILQNPKRTTPAGMNVGIEAATADVVALVGAHSLLDTRFAEASRDALFSTGAAAVGGVITVIPSDESSHTIALAQTSVLAMGAARYRSSGPDQIEVDTVPFPAFLKETWSRLGGFDERLLRNQDDEFLQRVREDSGRVLLCPEISFRYVARSSLRSLAMQYFEYGRFRVLTVRIRGRPGSMRPLGPLLLVLVTASTVAFAVRRRSWAGLSPAAGYTAAACGEGMRLSRSPGPNGLKVAAAIVAMHVSYGLGEWAGLCDMFREGVRSRWGQPCHQTF
jgi:succinoglycan biosynthesis protein ExoA